MAFRSAGPSQRSLLFTLVILLGCGFLATSLLSYYASRTSIRDNIINTELPLTSDTVYSEIQKDLVRPVLISSMMARDTFMRDWVVEGERNPQQITRYLKEVMDHYGAFTTFFCVRKQPDVLPGQRHSEENRRPRAARCLVLPCPGYGSAI